MSPDEIATIDETEVADVPIEDTEVADIPRTYWLPSGVYIALKWATLIALPAVGVCYQALANVWSLPLAEEVSQTCNIVALLLGSLIGVSAAANQIRK